MLKNKEEFHVFLQKRDQNSIRFVCGLVRTLLAADHDGPPAHHDITEKLDNIFQ